MTASTASIAEIRNFDDYIQHFVPDLGRKIHERLRPLAQPGETWPRTVHRLCRRPFQAQGDAIVAGARVLDLQDSLWVIGEMGTGKTLIGAAIPHVHAQGKPFRCVVMCPGHLVKKWAREVQSTVPGATAKVIRSVKDLLPLTALRKQSDGGWQDPTSPEFYIVSRDRAKLGYFWRPAFRLRRNPANTDRFPACPNCGAFILDDDGCPVDEGWFSKTRRYCKAPVAPQYQGSEAGEVEPQEEAVCGNPLWQADGRRVRRFAPAQWIKNHLAGFFDYAIGDEVHELKGGATAQGNAFGSLAAASRKVIALTGTLLGGYADDLFFLLYRLQTRRMQEEDLAWNGSMKFMARYGVLETTIRESRGGGVIEEDNAASRGKRTTKTIRRKPGVSPLVFSRFLLDSAVFLQLADISDNLPPLSEEVVTVSLGPLEEGYRSLFGELRQALTQELCRGSKRLLGTYLNALLAYPDRPFGNPPIVYPGGSEIVARPVNYTEDRLYPKEEALMEFVREELALGRKVWVFCTFTGKKDVQPRLQALLQRDGIHCEILRQSVPPEEREEWVKERLKEGVEVVLCNPELVKTGLDLLDFPSLAFYETGYNCFTLRQASRRSWRIGQTEAVKVRYFAYAGTLQEQALQLMGSKLKASMALEGKFSEEGLQAMCQGDDLTTALARAIVDGLDGVESAESIWRSMSKQAPPKEVEAKAKAPRKGRKVLALANTNARNADTRRVLGLDAIRDLFGWPDDSAALPLGAA